MKKNLPAGRQGFTLIEILVAVTLMVVIMTIGSTVLISLLRATAKAKIMTTAQQSGNYALEVMERMIRNARQVENRSGGGVIIVNPDKGKSCFYCDTNSIASASSETCNNPLPLTNTQILTIDSCGINYANKVVTISYTLTQIPQNVRPEDQVSLNFQTSVTSRN